ncbi:hypothetical protein QBC43DRAFT_284864 [Cladorrhinum sp. PSN259]|nr:hypothetical protein QBC43DRAFT_284864 [Cladorrhinum sp. PSN259]
MDHSISVHGLGAIKDSRTSDTFTVQGDKGSALIRPTNVNRLTEWIYYALPSPPPGYTGLKNLTIDCSSQNALGNHHAWSTGNYFQQISTFTQNIPSGQAAYAGKGILVAIYIEFEVIAASLTIQSVSIGI